jgi:hypothetical protein
LEPNILTLPFWPSGVPHCAFEDGEVASIAAEVVRELLEGGRGMIGSIESFVRFVPLERSGLIDAAGAFIGGPTARAGLSQVN